MSTGKRAEVPAREAKGAGCEKGKRVRLMRLIGGGVTGGEVPWPPLGGDLRRCFLGGLERGMAAAGKGARKRVAVGVEKEEKGEDNG